jgi:hypothetical protein
MQILEGSAGDEQVAAVGPGDDGLTPAILPQWRRLPNRMRWVVMCYCILLFSPYLVSEFWRNSELLMLGTFAVHYSVASLLGLWAASRPRPSVERFMLVLFATGIVGVIVSWCLDADLSEVAFWFIPATVIAFGVFAGFGRFGWRIRPAATLDQLSSLRFSVRQLMMLTAAVAVGLVIAQQLARAFQVGDYDFWGPIGLGVVMAPALVVAVWAFLAAGRTLPKLLLAILTVQMLGFVALYAIDEWSGEALLIVLTWGLVYFLFISLPLLVLRSRNFRFTQTLKAQNRLK